MQILCEVNNKKKECKINFNIDYFICMYSVYLLFYNDLEYSSFTIKWGCRPTGIGMYCTFSIQSITTELCNWYSLLNCEILRLRIFHKVLSSTSFPLMGNKLSVKASSCSFHRSQTSSFIRMICSDSKPFT